MATPEATHAMMLAELLAADAGVKLAQAKAVSTAMKGKAKVVDAQRAQEEKLRKEKEAAMGEQPESPFPTGLTATPLTARSVQDPESQLPAGALAQAGAAGAQGGAAANKSIVGARQQMGTAGTPQGPAQGGRPSINVGGQTFSAPPTRTTTRATTAPREVSQGLTLPMTSYQQETQENVLTPGNILNAQIAQERTAQQERFWVAQLAQQEVAEGRNPVQALTWAKASMAGDYATAIKVAEGLPKALSVQLAEHRIRESKAGMIADNQRMQLYLLQAQKEGLEIQFIKDAMAAQSVQGSLNDLFGIPSPVGGGGMIGGPSMAGLSLPGMKGGLTENQVLTTFRMIRTDEKGVMDPKSQAAFRASQGIGLSRGNIIYMVPKEGDATPMWGEPSAKFKGVGLKTFDEMMALMRAAEGEADLGPASKELLATGLFVRQGGDVVPISEVSTAHPNAEMAQGLFRAYVKLSNFRELTGAEPPERGAQPMPQEDPSGRSAQIMDALTKLRAVPNYKMRTFGEHTAENTGFAIERRLERELREMELKGRGQERTAQDTAARLTAEQALQALGTQ